MTLLRQYVEEITSRKRHRSVDSIFLWASFPKGPFIFTSKYCFSLSLSLYIYIYMYGATKGVTLLMYILLSPLHKMYCCGLPIFHTLKLLFRPTTSNPCFELCTFSVFISREIFQWIVFYAYAGERVARTHTHTESCSTFMVAIEFTS